MRVRDREKEPTQQREGMSEKKKQKEKRAGSRKGVRVCGTAAIAVVVGQQKQFASGRQAH